MEISNTRTYIHTGVMSLLVLAIVGYIFFQTRNVIRGPIITIQTPQNGATLEESLVIIKGVAKNISYISLNDRNIFIDEQGRFQEKLLLSYGYNIMAIKAEDKFGRKTEEILELVYK